MVREGLARCRAAGLDGIVVLGHAEYYPRFGFVPAHQLGLRCEYDVPADVFMALELTGERSVGSRGLSGTTRRLPALEGSSYAAVDVLVAALKMELA